MYLPTGTPHAARAQETVSLHVTLGINQLTWRGLVERTVRPLLEHVDGAHLPAGYHDDPTDVARGLSDRLSGLIDALAALIRTLPPPQRWSGSSPAGPPGCAAGSRTSRQFATWPVPPGCEDARPPVSPGSSGRRLRVLLGDRELV